MTQEQQSEPVETLRAIAARVMGVEKALDLGDIRGARRRVARLLKVLPEPDKRHLEAARTEE